jgi:colanic acid/amylovoran biosynthesis protein
MVKDNPTIGLYGIWGVYNYGCEAIIRGTEIIIRKMWPDANIKYVSPRPEDDLNRLKGCNVEIVPRKFHKLPSIDRLNSTLGEKTGFYSKKFFHEDLKWTETCDMIFSIGGDLYTLPPGYKDPKIKKYYNPLIHFEKIMKAREKKFIIWGASIGPFEGYPKAKKAFTDQLHQTDLITSREPVTTNYLKNLGIENVTECIDPAFMVPRPKNIKNNINVNKLHIGINLSPLSAIYSFKSNMRDKLIKEQVNLITSLIKKFDAYITLIPHVVCGFDINDDDLRYLKLVKSQIDIDLIDHVEIIEEDIGFIGTKEILANCNIVLAARMHCAINSLSLGVPTIFLAYSKKAYGMAEYVYGNSKWVIPLKGMNDTEKVLHVLNRLIDEYNELISDLDKLNKSLTVKTQEFNKLFLNMI